MYDATAYRRAIQAVPEEERTSAIIRAAVERAGGRCGPTVGLCHGLILEVQDPATGVPVGVVWLGRVEDHAR